MEGFEKLLTSELGVFVVCLILVIREFRTAFIEYLKSKKSATPRRETDLHIKETNESLKSLATNMEEVKTTLDKWEG